MIYRQGVLCTRVFTGCLANELGPYPTKKIITLALPLQPTWASVVRKSCKFWLNWTLIEAVFKWPVRRRETIQVVGLCLLQSPSIIAIILWKQTNKTSHWVALVCFDRLFTVYHQQIKNQFKSIETVKVTCSSLLVNFFFKDFTLILAAWYYWR